MKITWLGQGGFLFEVGGAPASTPRGARVAVDPYLSDALAPKGLPRLAPPPMTPKELAPTLVVCTHDHSDHFDPVTIAEIVKHHPGCLHAGPPSVIAHAQKMGIAENQCVALREGASLEHGGFTVRATFAEHPPEAIGLLIEADGGRVYVSGDTVYSERLAESAAAAAGGQIDLALVCINGRWGNMNADEALKVVARLKPRAAAPMHHELFASNSADPRPFLDGVRALGLLAVELRAGEAVDLRSICKDTAG